MIRLLGNSRARLAAPRFHQQTVPDFGVTHDPVRSCQVAKSGVAVQGRIPSQHNIRILLSRLRCNRRNNSHRSSDRTIGFQTRLFFEQGDLFYHHLAYLVGYVSTLSFD